MYQAIKEFLQVRGEKYMAPAKAGPLVSLMEEYRAQGQAARKEFTDLAKSFAQRHPEWNLHRTSQWMNQGQVLRPHFWAYLQGQGSETEPMMALRLYGDAADFGVSLEVSFLERKKDEESLIKQARVLDVAVSEPLYYLVQSGGESQVVGADQASRRDLRQGLEEGSVRKVLVKGNVNLSQAESLEQVLEDLEQIYDLLLPVYRATRKEKGV